MEKTYKFIFDMDGTLYQFDKGKAKSFDSSFFYKDLMENILQFFINDLQLEKLDAINKLNEISRKYKGEISIGVKQEFKIDIFEYFKKTWNLEPRNYLNKNLNLKLKLNPLKGNVVLLTAAPRIWVEKVLNYLEIKTIFKESIYTGEPNVRKPDPAIFRQIARDLQIKPEKIFSIGDQEESDIIPAKSVGMKTLRIGQDETTADYQAEDIISAINLLTKKGFI